MPKLYIGRQQCQIVDEYDLEFIRKLDRELSFWVQGAEHSPAYKGYIDKKSGRHVTWDGYKRLLTKSLKFSPGLLHRVKEAYAREGRIIQIMDIRPSQDPCYPVEILPALKKQGITPYYYQLDTVEAAKQNERGIIRLATGAGKTLCIALITAALGKSTIIYVIGKDLLYQIHAMFESLFDQKIGIIGDGKCEVGDINIATVWTVAQALGINQVRVEDEGEEKKVAPEKYKEIKAALGRSRLHILDECHLSACKTIQGIFKWINPENIYGMSASPWRDDGADLLIENYLGNKIIDLSARDLIPQGYLVPPIIKFLTVPKQKFKKRTHYKTVYSQYIAENTERNAMVAKGAGKLVEQGYQTLVLFHNLKHGDRLYQEIAKKIPCEILSGKDSNDKRQEVKNKLENKEINCVLASKIFDIGVDIPSLSGLVLAGGGKSSVRALQRVGRVIRKYPGKTKAAVIDFADQAKYLLDHSKIRRDIYAEEFNVIWPENQ